MPTAKEASTVAAMQAVFQTSELVENILVHLPANTIFGTQRVCKSFNNAVKNSLPIKEKLFLRLRPEPAQKVIVYGFQHTVAALNPIFVQGAFYDNYAVHHMPLSSRNEPHEKYGVTIKHNCVLRLESSLLDTYLLSVPFKKLKLSLRLRVGKGGPMAMIDEVDVVAKQSVTIRAMIDSVLKHPQEIGLTFDEARWRGDSARYPRAGRAPRRFESSAGDGWIVGTRFFRNYRDAERDWNYQRGARMDLIPDLPLWQVTQRLHGAQVAGRSARWGCDTFAKPTEVVRELQKVAGPSSTVYVSLSQQPTFLLQDIVVPSPKDWAEIAERRA